MSVPLGCHGEGQRGIETEEGRACCQVRTDRDGCCGFTYSLAVSNLCLMLFCSPLPLVYFQFTLSSYSPYHLYFFLSCPLSSFTLSPSFPSSALPHTLSFCPCPLLPSLLSPSHSHSSLPPTLTPLTLIIQLTLREQELANLLSQDLYSKAVGLAISLNQPLKLYNILHKLLEETGQEGVFKSTICSLREDQIGEWRGGGGMGDFCS